MGFMHCPRPVLRDWYIERAEETILPRVRRHAKKLGVVFKQARIVDNRYRWGSCTARDLSCATGTSNVLKKRFFPGCGGMPRSSESCSSRRVSSTTAIDGVHALPETCLARLVHRTC